MSQKIASRKRSKTVRTSTNLIRATALIALAVLAGGAGTGPRRSPAPGRTLRYRCQTRASSHLCMFRATNPGPKVKPHTHRRVYRSALRCPPRPRWIYVWRTAMCSSHKQALSARHPNQWKIAFIISWSAIPSHHRKSNHISLLRASNHDGVVDRTQPSWLTISIAPSTLLLNGKLYIADTGSMRVYPYHNSDTHIAAKAKRCLDLPVGLQQPLDAQSVRQR